MVGVMGFRVSSSESGSYLRLIVSRSTQLKAQGPSRTFNEFKEENKEAEALITYDEHQRT